MKNPRLCVVGACNIDLTAYVPRMPAWGETLRGTRFRMGFGGKGANQAVMAAKLGARVAMVAKLGRDAFGQNTLRNFERFGVNTQHVHFTDEAFSGVALITVDPDGRNAIVVVTGANDLLTPADVEAARDVIAASSGVDIGLRPTLGVDRGYRPFGWKCRETTEIRSFGHQWANCALTVTPWSGLVDRSNWLTRGCVWSQARAWAA